MCPGVKGRKGTSLVQPSFFAHSPSDFVVSRGHGANPLPDTARANQRALANSAKQVIEEDYFEMWAVGDDDTAGKTSAMFQVTAFLDWLRGKMDEDEEQEMDPSGWGGSPVDPTWMCGCVLFWTLI